MTPVAGSDREEAEAQLRPLPGDRLAVLPAFHATTDEKGEFRLNFPRTDLAARLWLHVQHASHVTVVAGPVNVGESAAPPEMEIEMAPGTAIEGVVEVVGSSPRLKGRVAVETKEHEVLRLVDLDEAGAFRIAGIPPGDVSIRLEDLRSEPDDAGGFAPAEANIRLEEGETRHLSLRTMRGCAVDVRVRRAGALVEYADVQVWAPRTPIIRPSAVRAEEGIYSFRGVPPGSAKVHTWTGGTLTETVFDASEGARVVVEVDIPTAKVRGHVRLTGTTALASRICLVLARRHADWNFAWAEPDGQYVFDDVPPGSYTLVVEERDAANGDDQDDRHAASVHTAIRAVEVRTGETTIADFDLKPAGAVTVHLLDPAGKPFVGGVVSIDLAGHRTDPEDRWNIWFRAGGVTGADGAVRIRGLDDGRYTAYFDQSEFGDTQSEPFDVAAATESAISIRAREAGRTRVLFEVTEPDGSEAFGRDLTFLDAGGTEVPTEIPHGSPKAHAVAIVTPGEYRLKIEGDRWKTVERAVHVPSASPLVVRVSLEEKAQ